MKVLLISRDEGFLVPPASQAEDLTERHLLYARRLAERVPGSELRVLVLARHATTDLAWRDRGGLTVAVVKAVSPRGLAALCEALARPSALLGSWAPELITTQTPLEDGLFGRLLARRVGARFVAQAHFQLAQLDATANPALRRVRQALCGHVLRGADAIRFVSESQAAAFRARYGLRQDRTRIVPVAMMIATEGRSPPRSRQPVVLFVGRFSPEKNLPRWLEAARRVADAVPRARFRLAGDGPELPTARRLATELGLADRIEFTGPVPPSRVGEMMDDATVFLLASDTESFGRVVVEAAAHGLPTVATACEGPGDLIEAGVTGFLRDRADVAGLADDTIRLLVEPGLARRMGEAARARLAGRFAPGAIADTLVNLWVTTVDPMSTRV